jgi:uncharacterized protein (TIGR03067 family)
VSASVEPPAATADELEGVWLPIAADVSGRELEVGTLRVARLVIAAHVYRILDRDDHVVDNGEWRRAAHAAAQGIDLVGSTGPHNGKRIEALFELSGDRLLLCYDLESSERPAGMEPVADQLLLRITYARVASAVLPAARA